MTMPLRRGAHGPLEDAANAIIKESLAGVTKHSDKADILTPWKAQERQRREVLVPSGTPDASVRRGVFHRVINPSSPHLNSREGTASRARRGPSGIAIQIAEGGGNTDMGFDWDSE